jgi:hypothetical protein
LLKRIFSPLTVTVATMSKKWIRNDTGAINQVDNCKSKKLTLVDKSCPEKPIEERSKAFRNHRMNISLNLLNICTMQRPTLSYLPMKTSTPNSLV